MAVPILIRRPSARQVRSQAPPRSPGDRLSDILAAAAAVWAAAALVLAILLALAVTAALVLVAGLAVADAASYHERGRNPTMRSRITSTLVTTAATAAFAVAGPGLAGAALARPAAPPPASSLPVIATDSFGGYEASGRDFRYIHALIVVPNAPQDAEYPQLYVQLSNGSLGSGASYSRAGIETCLVAENLDPSFTCPGGVDWVGFIEAFTNSGSSPSFTHFVPLDDVTQGDGVGFGIYYNQAAGNAMSYTLTAPGGQQYNFQTPASGPIFDHAAALADYTNSSGTPIPLSSGSAQYRLTQFWQGALTTYSGVRGSWTGQWTTSAVEATSNGDPFPQGTVELSPGPLWSDGIATNGAVRGNDVFGVWRRA